MSANTLNTTTYNSVAANTVTDAVIDAPAILTWRQDVKAVVDQHASEINLNNPNKVTTKSANATLTNSDVGIIEVTAAADVTITLPTSATLGQRYTIKKVDAGSGKVIVGTTSSQTIDGATTQNVYNRYDQITVVSNGTGWDIVGRINKGEPWIAPTLLNSWVNYGGSNADAGYYKDDLGRVEIRGTIKNGTTAASTNLFILPAGYRPSKNIRRTVYCFNGAAISPAYIAILPTGEVVVDSVALAGNTLLVLDLFPFRAEQ